MSAIRFKFSLEGSLSRKGYLESRNLINIITSVSDMMDAVTVNGKTSGR